MTAFTSRFRLFTPRAVPRPPLWALLLEAEPAPPVNQFTAAAPDQAPLNTSSEAVFSNVPASVPFPSVRLTLSINDAVRLVTLFQLILPAAAALKVLVDGLLLGAWIGCRVVKSQTLEISKLLTSKSRSITENGTPTRPFSATVACSWVASPILLHLFIASKPL